MGTDATVYQEIDPAITSEFVGYDSLTADSKVTVLTTETDIVPVLTDGDKGTIIVEKTPFYGTMGGQNGDTGVIKSKDGEFKVETTIHLPGGKIGHVGVMTNGQIKVDDVVTLSVDTEKRALIASNHSATHLLQGALRKVLGDHVQQSGSDVTEERLRFDFTHFQAMTKEEIKKVEELVNEAISASVDVVTDIMSLDEAKKSGAMALFGEKYGDSVRVVRMAEFSTELCGGTHVKNTGDIKAFKIISENGISAGVRRIEAITSKALFAYYAEIEEKLMNAASLLKTTPDEISNKIESLNKEIKELKSENESLKQKAANESLGDVMDRVEDVNGIKFLSASIEDTEMGELRNLGDSLKEKLGSGVIVLAASKDGKASLVVMACDDAIAKGAHAGNIIKASASLIGGGGGGRPNMAQAGGKDASGIDAALKKAKETLIEQIG